LGTSEVPKKFPTKLWKDFGGLSNHLQFLPFLKGRKEEGLVREKHPLLISPSKEGERQEGGASSKEGERWESGIPLKRGRDGGWSSSLIIA